MEEIESAAAEEFEAVCGASRDTLLDAFKLGRKIQRQRVRFKTKAALDALRGLTNPAIVKAVRELDEALGNPKQPSLKKKQATLTSLMPQAKAATTAATAATATTAATANA